MKLSGLQVVDFSPTVPGSVLARLMADHGAEVIKIEPPGGSAFRQDAANPDLVAFCDRGKSVVQLDLKDPAAREQAIAMVCTADVLVESMRPGTLERLGLGYGPLAARHPALVYASVSSYGHQSPLSTVPGHDLSIRALAGGLVTQDNRAAPPVTMDIALAGAYLALSGVLMALRAVDRTGRGDWLDLSLHDVALTLQGHRLGEATARPPKTPRPLHPFLDSYQTRDERWICLAGRESAFVHTLLSDLDLTHLVDMAALSQPPAALRTALAECFLRRTQAEWIEWFEGRNVAFAPALEFHEALAHPQVAARGMLVEDAQGRQHLNTPLRFLQEPAQPVFHLETPAQEKVAAP